MEAREVEREPPRRVGASAEFSRGEVLANASKGPCSCGGVFFEMKNTFGGERSGMWRVFTMIR